MSELVPELDIDQMVTIHDAGRQRGESNEMIAEQVQAYFLSDRRRYLLSLHAQQVRPRPTLVVDNTQACSLHRTRRWGSANKRLRHGVNVDVFAADQGD
jgi:hypothetical protein